MGTSVTNGYDVVFEVSELAFRKQLAALPALLQTIRTAFNAPPFGGRARVHLSRPSAEFKSPPFVSERITISVDIAGSAIILTQPAVGLIPLEGTLELGGRVRVRTPAGATGTREVVLDFTTNNGGPDVLQLTFPPGAPATSAGLQSIGIQPNQAILDVVRNLIVAEVRTWVTANLRAVPLAAPIPVAAAPAGPFAATQVDAHVIEDPSGPDRDALAIAVATCMGANSGLDPTAFTTSSVPVGQDAAVLVSNFTLLSCIVCPAVATGLGLPTTAFGPPCALLAPVGITITGAPPVTLTSLAATVTPGGVIAIRGTIRRSTVVWTFTGTFGVDIALTLATTPTGPAIVPVATVLPSTATLTVVWWAWVVAAVILAVLLPVVVAVVLLIAAAIANGIANSGLAAAITAGIGGALPAPGAIPLGPLAAGFTPTSLTLDDLTLTGSITLAPAPGPSVVVTDSAREPIDAVQLTPRLEQTSSTFTIYVHNRGTMPLTLHSVTKADDPANAFTIPDGSVLPRTIQPDELYALPCRFQPPQAGLFLPTVTVDSSDPFGPATADIEAQAIPLPPHGRLELTPNPLDFGKVIATTQSTQNVTFKNVGNASLDVTNVALTAESAPGWFLLPWSWPGTIPTGQSRTLPITFAPLKVGAASASMVVDITSANGVYRRSQTLGLSGRAGAPIIRLVPTLLDFGALAPGASGNAPFEIHNNGDMDLEVTGVWRVAGQPDFLLDPAITFPLTVPVGGQQLIGVTTTAAPWPGYVNTNEFEIRSNDPATPGARLICRCTAAGPRLEFQPDFVEFRRPPVSPAKATITIYNRGSAQLDVGPVKVGGPPFSLVGLPSGVFPVPAGGSQSFEVQFSPTMTGDFLDRVTVHSNDALHPNVAIGIHAAW